MDRKAEDKNIKRQINMIKEKSPPKIMTDKRKGKNTRGNLSNSLSDKRTYVNKKEISDEMRSVNSYLNKLKKLENKTKDNGKIYSVNNSSRNVKKTKNITSNKNNSYLSDAKQKRNIDSLLNKSEVINTSNGVKKISDKNYERANTRENLLKAKKILNDANLSVLNDKNISTFDSTREKIKDQQNSKFNLLDNNTGNSPINRRRTFIDNENTLKNIRGYGKGTHYTELIKQFQGKDVSQYTAEENLKKQEELSSNAVLYDNEYWYKKQKGDIEGAENARKKFLQTMAYVKDLEDGYDNAWRKDAQNELNQLDKETQEYLKQYILGEKYFKDGKIPEEIDIYGVKANAYDKLREKFSDEEIEKHVTEMKYITDAEKAEEAMNKAKIFAEDNPILASLVSVPQKFSSFLALPEIIDALIDDRPVNTNAGGFIQSKKGLAERKEVTDNYDINIGDVDVFDLFYNGLMSAGDFGLLSLSGPVGAPILAGLQSMSNETNRLIDMGMTSKQAAESGIVKGMTEGLSALVSMKGYGSYKDISVKNISDCFKNFAAAAGVDIASDFISLATYKTYDTLQNGKFSEINRLKNGFRQMGYSENEAKELAVKTQREEIMGVVSSDLLSSGILLMGNLGKNTFKEYLNDSKIPLKNMSSFVDFGRNRNKGLTESNGNVYNENYKNVNADKYITIRRIQGGKGKNKSRKRILINPDYTISIPNKKSQLNISIDNGEHAKYFSEKRGKRSYILLFDVPENVADSIVDSAIEQKNYRSNPLNMNRTAPKLTDYNTPGNCYEISKDWINLLEKTGINARKEKYGGKR